MTESMTTSPNGIIFRVTVLCDGIHRSPEDSPQIDQWRGPLILDLVCTWSNGWANSRNAGDMISLWLHCKTKLNWHISATVCNSDVYEYYIYIQIYMYIYIHIPLRRAWITNYLLINQSIACSPESQQKLNYKILRYRGNPGVTACETQIAIRGKYQCAFGNMWLVLWVRYAALTRLYSVLFVAIIISATMDS